MPRIACILAAAAVVACGGGSDSGSDEPPTPSPEYIAAAERAANAALLTLEDAPAGWTSAPQGEDDEVDYEFTGECADFNEDDPFSGEVAFAESEELSGPDGQTVYTDATAFESEKAARDAVDSVFDSVFGQCRTQYKDFFAAAIREVFAEDGVDPATVAVDVLLQDASVPEQGDDSRGFRLKMHATAPDATFEIDLVLDIVAIRDGSLLGSLTYFAPEPDEGNRDALAATISRKLAAAVAELPE